MKIHFEQCWLIFYYLFLILVLVTLKDLETDLWSKMSLNVSKFSDMEMSLKSRNNCTIQGYSVATLNIALDFSLPGKL